MTGGHVGLVVVGVAIMLAGLGLVAVWRSARRTVRTAERTTREITRMTVGALRTVVAAVVIVAIQYTVLTAEVGLVWHWCVLAVPGLLAGAATARLLGATTDTRPMLVRGVRR
ncbi:putative membrane protein [Actinoalloteichus hoggarensis]|uniref:Uncharacterized protein n=1 Tax=Actinoalloteichus hoggarensis TaxID=1470176 RepID=A0A221W5C2_9PSEU|nr:hypothetical protein [Actinoalloteichus hoggarensis]ASO21058.1 hypothetical protein AHOG_17165 [Actinoalloteichus hoggarensis]MBB5920989.1 putative membrane protein [Actinoalloteichus hoggarensis]